MSSISAIGPRNILGSQTQSSHLNNLQKRSTIGSSFGAWVLQAYEPGMFGAGKSSTLKKKMHYVERQEGEF